MSDYHFTTTAVVPEEVVREIISDYMAALMVQLGDIELSDKQINAIATKMDLVANIHVAYSRISVDGYHLESKQILEIAGKIRNQRKIDAIKAFRQYTGAGLKEAKDFIDSFCIGDRKDTGVVPAIRFAMAFGK